MNGEFTPALPWSLDNSAEARFRVIVGIAFFLFLVWVTLVSIVEPPPIDRSEAEKLPERLARLTLEQKKEPPKPEPVVEEVKEKPVQKPEEKEVSVPEKLQELKERVAPKDPTDEQIQKAREKASKSGLLAMRDQLSALRDLSSSTTSSLRQAQQVGGNVGRQVERDLIASSATSGSGGVRAAAISHQGGGTLQARQTTQVKELEGAPTIAEVKAKSKGRKRTNEEIKLAFDANKSALYGIYNRALRQNPLLEGRVVLQLTVDSQGRVTECSIVSSALGDPELEKKLVSRVLLIDFGARKVDVWTGTYHIDFVPSS